MCHLNEANDFFTVKNTFRLLDETPSQTQVSSFDRLTVEKIKWRKNRFAYTYKTSLVTIELAGAVMTNYMSFCFDFIIYILSANQL